MKRRPQKRRDAALGKPGERRPFSGGPKGSGGRFSFQKKKDRRGQPPRGGWKRSSKVHAPVAADTKVQTEVSAGGIVYRYTPRGMRIGFILDPYGKWGFAKGHVEAGEEIVDAAVRETREEMGLYDLKVIAPLGTIDFWFRDRYRAESKGALVHKYVHYFLMEAPPLAKGRPQRKEKIRKIIWVGLRRAMHTSNYDDLRPVLENLHRYFQGRGDEILPATSSDAGGDLSLE